MDKKNIYIMISSTPTRFGGILRRFGGISYNHASIGLDKRLNRLYSFARIQHNSLLLCGLVKETVPRFTLKKKDNVDVMIFKLPVTTKQYKDIEERIAFFYNNEEYLYNLFSVLSYPITKGFATYKAFSCIEFVIDILGCTDYKFDKPAYQYTPDDFVELFADYLLFDGNLLDYCTEYGEDERYFAPMSVDVAKKSVKSLSRIVHRSFFERSSDIN